MKTKASKHLVDNPSHILLASRSNRDAWENHGVKSLLVSSLTLRTKLIQDENILVSISAQWEVAHFATESFEREPQVGTNLLIQEELRGQLAAFEQEVHNRLLWELVFGSNVSTLVLENNVHSLQSCLFVCDGVCT